MRTAGLIPLLLLLAAAPSVAAPLTILPDLGIALEAPDLERATPADAGLTLVLPGGSLTIRRTAAEEGAMAAMFERLPDGLDLELPCGPAMYEHDGLNGRYLIPLADGQLLEIESLYLAPEQVEARLMSLIDLAAAPSLPLASCRLIGSIREDWVVVEVRITPIGSDLRIGYRLGRTTPVPCEIAAAFFAGDGLVGAMSVPLGEELDGETICPTMAAADGLRITLVASEE